MHRQLEDSLQRLGVARVDAVLIHGMDHAVAEARAAAAAAGTDPAVAEETVLRQVEAPDGGLAALVRLRDGGRIGAVGVAVNVENPIFPHDEAKRVAWNVGWFRRLLAVGARAVGAPRQLDFVMVAGMHTLLNQTAFSSGLLDAAQTAGVAVLMAAPFNSGILARDHGDFEGAWFSYSAAPPATVQRARELLAVCEAHGVPLRAAALLFPLGHPAVVSVVVGAKSAAEWADCLALAKTVIPRAFWADLKAAGLIPEAVPVPAGPAA